MIHKVKTRYTSSGSIGILTSVNLLYWALFPINLGYSVGVFFLLARHYGAGWLFSSRMNVFCLFFFYWFFFYQFVYYVFIYKLYHLGLFHTTGVVLYQVLKQVLYKNKKVILTKRVECSPIVRETWVQSQVESYQRLKNRYLIPPCLTVYIIR